MAVKLIYKDIALGADADAVVSTSQAESFSVIKDLPFGVETPAVATGEPNGWGLSHDYGVRDSQPFAFWSKDRSGADCVFASPPVVSFAFSKQYTSTGLTVRFAPESMDYCAEIAVSWYQGGTVKVSETFYPESPEFVLQKTVSAFDRVDIAFKKTSLPGKRAKVEKVIMGVIREFKGDELKSASFVHEIDLISDVVPINVLDASFHSKKDVEFVFQRKQPVEGYNNDKLVGVYYIEGGRRTGVRDYEISCQDAIGVLEADDYAGGIWINDTPLETIIAEVFGDTFVFDIAPDLAGSTLRGAIEAGSKRDALQQIAFALGAVVDTSGSTEIKLYKPNKGSGDAIQAAKTFTGGSIDVQDVVTEVTVTAYVLFDERPGDNDSYLEIGGKKYRYYTETKHAYNPDSVASDLPKRVKFTGAYLVNLSNAQALADNIMAYYMRRQKYSFRNVLEGQDLGDRSIVYLPWGGTATGDLTKMTISVSGITVSDTEMLLD